MQGAWPNQLPHLFGAVAVARTATPRIVLQNLAHASALKKFWKLVAVIVPKLPQMPHHEVVQGGSPSGGRNHATSLMMPADAPPVATISTLWRPTTSVASKQRQAEEWRRDRRSRSHPRNAHGMRSAGVAGLKRRRLPHLGSVSGLLLPVADVLMSDDPKAAVTLAAMLVVTLVAVIVAMLVESVAVPVVTLAMSLVATVAVLVVTLATSLAEGVAMSLATPLVMSVRKKEKNAVRLAMSVLNAWRHGSRSAGVKKTLAARQRRRSAKQNAAAVTMSASVWTKRETEMRSAGERQTVSFARKHGPRMRSVVRGTTRLIVSDATRRGRKRMKT